MSWFFPFSGSSATSVLNESHQIRLFVQNEEHRLNVADFSPESTLNDYLRKTLFMTGTKNMCLEGGCGACIVVITKTDPVTENEVTFAVNSCLVPIYMCSELKIQTIEALGTEKFGYHPLQKAMVEQNGTQCGFCTPGMIMNMYSLYETGNFTMEDVENSFGGNICRCTGYRPILKAFKSFANDADFALPGTCHDIEEIPVCKRKQGGCIAKTCSKITEPYFHQFGASKWMKVFSVNEILDVLRQFKDSTCMLVGGNTASGVYHRVTSPDIFIDVTSVKTLHEHYMDGNNLVMGANITLTNAMRIFHTFAKKTASFSYLSQLADHIDLIANVPVRNIGTLAGNLSIKHDHNEFPSDIFLILETIGAIVTIVGIDQNEISKTVLDYITFDMKNKIIKNIILPPLEKDIYKFGSYKIMPRAQNAHALVNAGFLLKLDNNNNVKSARIVYGCIKASFTHAFESEKILAGKDLFDNKTLLELFESLDKELNPDHVLPDPEPSFRKDLAIALCYKFILSIAPENKISPRNKSGAHLLKRPLSSGLQDYQSNKSLYPLTEPIPKLEALVQCTGKANYVSDEIKQPKQLYAAFVTAKAPAYSIIKDVDTSEALAVKGVIAYYDKSSIPGKNTFTPKELGFSVEEELFCDKTVKYYDQPLGVIVAETDKLAETAAKLVHISYVDGKDKPKITIRDILSSNDKSKIIFEQKRPAKSRGNDVKHEIQGKYDIFGQYHFHMEKQVCVAMPNEEDGVDLCTTTQSTDNAQHSAAIMLNVPVTKVNVSVKRLGGAFGSKISRNAQISCAAALAAHKLKKTVIMNLSLSENMNIVGKRFPCSADYKIGVNDEGVIQYLDTNIYSDSGASGGNEPVISDLISMFVSAYNADTWNIEGYSTRSDTPTNTWCRAPATTEGLALCESIMDHIAYTLNKDPFDIRLNNMKKDVTLSKLIDNMKEWADVDNRKKEIEAFNKDNRWVKRGFSMVVMGFPLFYFGNFGVIVSIFHGDGSVAVSHGGIEMGQGINTKVAQVCAYCLKIPLNKISIKPCSTLTSPNSLYTGGSITSEAVCYATIKACDILLKRMEPVKKKMKNPTWVELIKQSYTEFVDLCATFMYAANAPDLKSYTIYGVTCTEVEIDILTGSHQVRRIDIIEDTGESMSPLIDIGQVEGAIIMGLGYWTSEKLVYTEEGELLTNRTWTYKPPGAKDIPIDFRIKFPNNSLNPEGVLNSKAIAEPPLCMTCSIPLAIKNALVSARMDANSTVDKWTAIDGPTTAEDIFVNSLNNYRQYSL